MGTAGRCTNQSECGVAGGGLEPPDLAGSGGQKDFSQNTCLGLRESDPMQYRIYMKPRWFQKRGNKVKITKTAQRAVLKDIRNQLKWIEQAIKDGDQNWIDVYSDQLSATAMELHSEVMKQKGE